MPRGPALSQGGLSRRQAARHLVSATALVLALVLTRAMAALLYATRGSAPATLAAAVVVLAGVTMLASYLPARRAAKTDPLQALRDQ